jgi:hypothetical protein
LLILEIPKSLILNDQEGTSLILSRSDFDEEEDDAFFSSTGLEP